MPRRRGSRFGLFSPARSVAGDSTPLASRVSAIMLLSHPRRGRHGRGYGRAPIMQLSLTGRHARRTYLSVLAIVLLTVPAFPQNVTGGLTGIVRDPSGSMVPNASLTATNTGTSASF